MNRYQSLAPWRGCKNVMFGYYNDYADPDLLYKGYVFNYYDVEDAMHETSIVSFPTNLTMKLLGVARKLLENTPLKPSTSMFVKNADMYIDELIANGYFHGDSKSWHDKM